MTRAIPLYTMTGVPDARVESDWIQTADGLGLILHRFSRDLGRSGDAVLLVHGLTTSTDMFIMPEHYNLVSYLLDHGYGEVYCLDSRMSNRLPYDLAPHPYTLDDLALYDYPAALAAIRERTACERLHVVSHCLGAVSFSMCLAAGLAPGVTSFVANSASLVIKVPAWSALKLKVGPTLIQDIFGFPYLSPRFANEPGLTRGKLLGKLVSLFHPECDVPACHMLSFMWGTGHPAVYEHHRLLEVTHRRGGDLYGATSLDYHRHVAEMVQAGHAVKRSPHAPRHASLPDDYLARAGDIEASILLLTGAENHIFADSNVACHEALEEIRPGRQALAVFPGRGHQDVFVGKDCDKDVFPRIAAFFDAHRGKRPAGDLPSGGLRAA
jgi:lysosomal acid lipase/cholesteryl ester hydrolase